MKHCHHRSCRFGGPYQSPESYSELSERLRRQGNWLWPDEQSGQDYLFICRLWKCFQYRQRDQGKPICVRLGEYCWWVPQNPVKTIKRNASYSLVIVTVLYTLANIAYFAAGMIDTIWRDNPCADNDFSAETRHQIIGCNGCKSILHQRIRQCQRRESLQPAHRFKCVWQSDCRANRTVSCHSRMWKVGTHTGQIGAWWDWRFGRQGVLPFPKFWASTKPFGTPIGPFFVKWAVTIIMILAPPAGDAFNFSEWKWRLRRTDD